jgi:hypothetical protein
VLASKLATHVAACIHLGTFKKDKQIKIYKTIKLLLTFIVKKVNFLFPSCCCAGCRLAPAPVQLIGVEIFLQEFSAGWDKNSASKNIVPSRRSSKMFT